MKSSLILSLALILCTSISGTTARTYVARSGGQNCAGFAMYGYDAYSSIGMQYDNCVGGINSCSNMTELDALLKQQAMSVVNWVYNKNISYIYSPSAYINSTLETRLAHKNIYRDADYNGYINFVGETSGVGDLIAYHWMVQVSDDKWAEKYPVSSSLKFVNYGTDPSQMPWYNTQDITAISAQVYWTFLPLSLYKIAVS